MAVVTPVAVPEAVGEPAGLAEALRAAGLADDVTTVRPVGPPAVMLSRWAVTTAAGRHVFVDAVGARWRGDPALPVPAPSLVRRCAAAADGTAHARHAVPLPGIGWAYPVPWAPDVLGMSVVLAAMAGLPMPAGLDDACRAVGGYLRRLHASPLARETADVSTPAPLERLRTPPAGALVTRDRAWRDLVDAVAAAPGEPAAVHGQLGLAHLVVPARPAEVPGPRVCLVGWTGVVAGAPAFDVGQVLGDFLEVAALFGGGSGRGLPSLVAAAAALRRGYEEAPGRPLPAGFWADAARSACVKVLDHDTRRIRAFGAATVPAHLLGDVAEALLDPRTDVGAVFADPTPERTTP